MKRQFLIILILLAPLLVGFAPDRQQAAITLNVSAGYDGLYQRGQWLPVRISISNQGDNLDGYVRVRLGGLGGLEETTYRTPLDLPRGSRKQLFLYVSVENYSRDIQVEIVNTDGHVAARDTASLRMTNRGDALYAVITQSPYGAVDLSARAIGSGTARQVNWRTEDIPPLAEALSGLDVMLFHDVDTGALRPEQIAALQNWVLSGGHLIVAGGDAWQRTTASLEDLLPVSLRGTVTLESAAAFGAYLRQPAEMLNEAITATVNTPGELARVLVAEGDQPLVVRHRYGAGWVDFLAVDPNAEPLRSWTGTRDLWYTLIASTGQRPSWARGFSEWSTARDATLTTSNTVLPTFLQLCGFLLAYIVLVGPVNYLVLKRVNRREWAWVTIPLLIVLFSVLAYRVGFNLRGNVAIVNRLTVVRAWSEQSNSQVMTLVGVQSPRRLYYDVAVERGYVMRTLPEGGVGVNAPVTVNESTRYEAQDILIDGGTVASLVAEGYALTPGLDAAAEWHLQPGAVPRITGAVVNTTGITLEDAIILIKGEARPLGTLEPGEQVRFEIEVGPQSPAALTLGSTYVWQRPYGYSMWGGGPYSMCFAHSGVPLTLPDVMQGEQFVCSTARVSEREHEIRRRYRLLGALVVDSDESGGRGSGAYIFAWSKQPYLDVELVGREQKTEDTTLHIFEMPVTVANPAARQHVPPGLTTWTVIETGDPATLQNVHPEQGFQVDGATQGAFQFMPLPPVRLARIDELAVYFQGQGEVLVELWDWDAQAWVSVGLDREAEMTVLHDAGRFAGPENAVNVRLSAPDSISYNRVNTIKVGYHGWLE